MRSIVSMAANNGIKMGRWLAAKLMVYLHIIYSGFRGNFILCI
ncbi:hypothetical protein HMPREF1568_3667 [Providencia alcalifaciens PAL-3]|nr:hypothetical protein HMPREF1568_3667 [Providencia alcalifaciens PAL-3]EUC99200.1 hypothetical protein HMPREF1566_3844 [Providencia alcalifaciens PAL-1]